MELLLLWQSSGGVFSKISKNFSNNPLTFSVEGLYYLHKTRKECFMKTDFYFTRKFYVNEKKTLESLTELLKIISPIKQKYTREIQQHLKDACLHLTGAPHDLVDDYIKTYSHYAEYKQIVEALDVVEKTYERTKATVHEFENPDED